MKQTSQFRSFLFGSAVLTPMMIAGSLQAAVILTVTDSRMGSGASRVTNTSAGTIGSATSTLPTLTYTINNLDFTTIGGGATEQVVFSVGFSQTNGTGIVYSGFGNVAVQGGNDNLVGGTETLTATLSLVSTTFNGGDLSNLSLGFTGMTIGGYGTNDNTNIIHDGGTINKVFATDTNPSVSFNPSSFITIDDNGSVDGTNIQAYSVEITAVPEPSVALLGGLGLLGLLRRRR